MTNPNPVSPKTILTENYVREKLDQIDYAFRHDSNRPQASLEEQTLCNQFIRASCVPGGVREPKKCAIALVEKCSYISL